jgi:hypothetical protein
MSKKRFEHIEGRDPAQPVVRGGDAGGVPFNRPLEPLSGARDASVEGARDAGVEAQPTATFGLRRGGDGAAATAMPLVSEEADELEVPPADEGFVPGRVAAGPSAFDDVPQRATPAAARRQPGRANQPVAGAAGAPMSRAPQSGAPAAVRRTRRVRKGVDPYELELARKRVSDARLTLLLMLGVPASIVIYLYLKYVFRH